MYLSGGAAAMVKCLGLNSNTPFYFSERHTLLSSPKLYVQKRFQRDLICLTLFINIAGFAMVMRMTGLVALPLPCGEKNPYCL
jgi:hypothetical protein